MVVFIAGGQPPHEAFLSVRMPCGQRLQKRLRTRPEFPTVRKLKGIKASTASKPSTARLEGSRTATYWLSTIGVMLLLKLAVPVYRTSWCTTISAPTGRSVGKTMFKLVLSGL